MIEEMIKEVKIHLPLKITNLNWDGTLFQIFGSNWSFTT